jgi:signal transduction histidine kinase
MRFLKALTARFRNLKLFPKLLVPFGILIIIMGVVGSFSTVRYLSSRAEGALDDDLFRRSVDGKVYVADSALYLLESVRFAANIQGVAEAVQARDPEKTAQLLASVLAVRTDLDLLVATDLKGRGLVEIHRTGRALTRTSGSSWTAGNRFVREVLAGIRDASGGDKRIGFLRSGDQVIFAVAGPVRTRAIHGVMIAGFSAQTLAAEAARRVGASVSVFDGSDALVGSSSKVGAARPPELVGGNPIRRTSHAGDEEIATLYAPLVVRDVRLGTVAITEPTAPAFASVRGAGLRLALILLVAMGAVVGIGLLLSRSILRQVRPLVATNRALGRGELTARAPVLGEDELGELARGFNLMAEQLQATYEELEMRVAARTEELQRLYQEVVKTSEARSQFFAAVSHEFRTPLFAIVGNADLMLEIGVDTSDETWKEFPQTIKGQGEHLLGLVNEILDLAKFESGRMEVELEDLSLPDVVRELRGTIVPLARKSELSVDMDVAENLPMVRADRTRLRQIILNLTSNAIKYTPAGGHVKLVAAQNNGRVEVSVADTGVGIPKEAADSLFEPFYQVKGTKAQKGQASSGLGLSLTKRLVEAHGGEIWFRPAIPGPGTTFTFTLQPAEIRKIRTSRKKGSEDKASVAN